MNRILAQDNENNELVTKIVFMNPEFYKTSWFHQNLPFFKEYEQKHGQNSYIGWFFILLFF